MIQPNEQILQTGCLKSNRNQLLPCKTGPDKANGRASASGAGGHGFDPWPRIPKALKMVPVATLLGAQHYKASTGSHLTHY